MGVKVVTVEELLEELTRKSKKKAKSKFTPDEKLMRDMCKELLDVFITFKNKEGLPQDVRECSKLVMASVGAFTSIAVANQLVAVLDSDGDLENDEEIDGGIAWFMNSFYKNLRKEVRHCIQQMQEENAEEEGDDE